MVLAVFLCSHSSVSARTAEVCLLSFPSQRPLREVALEGCSHTQTTLSQGKQVRLVAHTGSTVLRQAWPAPHTSFVNALSQTKPSGPIPILPIRLSNWSKGAQHGHLIKHISIVWFLLWAAPRTSLYSSFLSKIGSFFKRIENNLEKIWLENTQKSVKDIYCS